MRKKIFYIPSSNGTNRLYCVDWKPEGPVRAVLQITHGMVEYIERYESLARVLADAGIAVVGHDHLGHGRTAADEGELGFFAETKGEKAVLKDIHRLTVAAKKRYPGLPCFLMGHSMGSFFTRRYMTLYGRELDGVILMGTGWVSEAMAFVGWALSGIISRLMGGRYRSRLLVKLTLGAYEQAFRDEGRRNAWLSKERETVEAYNGDPFCNFAFTASAYHDFFTVLRDLAREKQFGRIPKDLPVFFLSGDCDPVGAFGTGVRKAYESIRHLGIQDVSLKLYENDRHELVNETDRGQVYEDIRQWLEGHIMS